MADDKKIEDLSAQEIVAGVEALFQRPDIKARVSALRQEIRDRNKCADTDCHGECRTPAHTDPQEEQHMADMTRRDTVAWAKEEVLAAIDEKLAALISQPHAISDIDLDEEIELKKQRNRVAKFLGLPEKK